MWSKNKKKARGAVLLAPSRTAAAISLRSSSTTSGSVAAMARRARLSSGARRTPRARQARGRGGAGRGCVTSACVTAHADRRGVTGPRLSVERGGRVGSMFRLLRWRLGRTLLRAAGRRCGGCTARLLPERAGDTGPGAGGLRSRGAPARGQGLLPLLAGERRVPGRGRPGGGGGGAGRSR